MEEQVAKIVGNAQITATLPNGRSLSVSCYLLAEDTAEALNARLDFFQAAIERQRTRCEIPELEAKREALIGHLSGVQVALAQLEAKREGGEKLSSQDKLNLRNATANVTHLAKEIEKGEAAIAEARKKAGVG